MAVENIWFFCLLSLGYCGLSVQEKPVSVELSCGAGPVHVVLEPDHPLLLECHLGASEPPLNVTWLRDGAVLSESQTIRPLPNRSLLISPSSTDGHAPAGVEGGYSCLSTSSTGALTSRALTLHLASLSRFLQDPEPQVVPVGGTARFECYVDGLPTPSVTWEKDQAPLPSPTEPLEPSRYISLPNGVLQILGVTKEDKGLYRCVAFNSARKRFSQEASLTVSPDGKPIATDVVVLATNLVIPDTRSHHAGVYVCRANKPKTRDFVSSPAELRVLAPPVIFQPPEAVSLSRGNTARFVCNSSGDPPPALRWLKNGEPVQSNARVKTQNPGVLLINQLRLDDAGYYQCIAANSLGTACATAKLSVIVREGLPSPPRHVSAIPHSSTSALLNWDPPEHNSDQIIGFSVHYQCTAGSDNMEYQFAVNNDTTELHVKELLPHTAYTFYVVAYSPMGASRPSQPVTVETLEDVPSASPQLSLLSTSPTDIRAMWLPLSSQLSRGAITRYRIDYRALEQVDHIYSVEVGGNETQVTLRDLKPNQTYQLRIVAGTRAGFSQSSEWASHHTPNLTQVLFAPTELKVRAKMHSLHVTWQPPPNHTQITGYKLSWRELDGEELPNEEKPMINERIQQIKLRKRVKHHEVTGLAPDQLYEVKVWAFNKQTEGYPAVWKGRTEKLTRVRTTDSLPPLPPISIRARANSSTSIWLRWEKPHFSNVRIINYTIRCSPAGLRNASLISYYTSSSQEIFLESLKPFTSYEIAVQSKGVDMSGPFSSTVEESTLPDRPSSPPLDMQLSVLDSYSVLVSWRPPLEPNGVILTYWILYTGNMSHPDHLWINLTHDGSVTSAEAQGLMSGTRYYFKMGACTEVGVGPYSPVKDVYTPPKKYELDIHAVTGIIVGVCLGLLCILLCMCVSFRNGKTRDVSGGLDSSSLSPQYRKGARPVPTTVPDCSDCHELETLMPSSAQDPNKPLTDLTEEQSLMANIGGADDAPAESMPAWNGSVSRNWANRITRYRDTITEDSSALINGALEGPPSDNSKSGHVERLYSLSKNQVEAEVIVHSQLSNTTVDQGPQSDMELSLESPTSKHPSPGEKATPTNPHPPYAHSEDNHETQSPSQTPSTHISEVLSNHNGPFESGHSQPIMGGAKNQGVGLANGFHLSKPLRSKAETLENGAHRLCPTGKVLPSPGLSASPSSFASSGLVYSTSGEHNYVYP
ncbi:immunoglobulin superfamily DCC subclass member 4-like [Sinocyclocheilus grahami]|nr:PREDICTED: immunoglobulin superfamily DCC subclass member 4-like [Sinocyclocheilus grahami]